MKSLSILLLLLSVIAIASAQSSLPTFVFIVQDCSAGCEYFNDDNWVGGVAPSTFGNIVIDYSQTDFNGDQYIVSTSSLGANQLNITSGPSNTVLLQLDNFAKVGSLNAFGASIVVSPDYALIVSENSNVLEKTSISVYESSIFAVYGNAYFGSNTNVYLYGNASFITYGNSQIQGNIIGYNNTGDIQFNGPTTILAADVISAYSLTFNDDLSIQLSKNVNVNVIFSYSNLELIGSSVTTVSIEVSNNVTLEDSSLTVNGRESNSANFIEYLSSDVNSVVDFIGGIMTTINNVQLNGITSVDTAPIRFSNGHIYSIAVDFSTPVIDVLMIAVLNVSIGNVYTVNGQYQQSFDLICAGKVQISSIQATSIQIITSPNSLLDLTNASIYFQDSSSTLYIGTSSIAIFNNTQIHGGKYISAVDGGLAYVFGNSVIKTQFFVTGSSTLQVASPLANIGSLVLNNNGTMIMDDGILNIDNQLTVLGGSTVKLVLDQLVVDMNASPIKASQGASFDQTSSIAVVSAGAIIPNTKYYTIATSRNIEAPINYSFVPTPTGYSVTFENTIVSNMVYLTFIFSK